MLYDHVDLRVSDLAKVRPLYDELLPAMGFSRLVQDKEDISYYRPEEDAGTPFFGLMADPAHRANGTRVALRAESREDVDRLAAIARSAGAIAFEAPENYSPDNSRYYAVFFEDADGNKLEICCRS